MTTAILIQGEELESLIEKAVSKALTSTLVKAPIHPAARAQATDSDYLTLVQAAKYLHISRPTFIALRKGGAFPAHPIGNRHLFRRSELDAYVQAQHIPNGEERVQPKIQMEEIQDFRKNNA